MIKTTATLAIVLAFAAPWSSTRAQTASGRYYQKLQPVLEADSAAGIAGFRDRRR
jgi:hypothetical protein